jgi:hypothetical protein
MALTKAQAAAIFVLYEHGGVWTGTIWASKRSRTLRYLEAYGYVKVRESDGCWVLTPAGRREAPHIKSAAG